MFALSIDSAKNVAIIVAVVFVGLSLLSAWVVKNVVMKMIFIVALAGLALGVWTQRTNLTDCVEQSKHAIEDGTAGVDKVTCTFFGTDVEVPAP